jgi:hypothetical protein
MEPVIGRIQRNELCTSSSFYMLLISCLELSVLFLSGLDMNLYLPAALISEAMLFTTILGAVALCYNIFLCSIDTYYVFRHCI